MNCEITEEATEQLKQHRQEQKIRNEAEENRILEEGSDDFRRTAKAGPLPRGRTKRFEKFHCKHCRLNFATSLGSMVAHAQSHKNDEVIKIGKVKGTGAAAGNLRPEQHTWNATTGKTFIGSDARYWKFVLPNSMLRDESGNLICSRKCGNTVEYSNQWSFQKQEKALDRHKKHEEKCKHKAK